MKISLWGCKRNLVESKARGCCRDDEIFDIPGLVRDVVVEGTTAQGGFDTRNGGSSSGRWL